MRNPISIKQIAAMAGVSTATVSKVINQKGGYSAETEQKIKALIEENHYTPNMLARGLQKNRASVIGILVPNIVNEHFSRFVLELEKVLFRSGYLTMICNTNESVELEQQHLKAMVGQNVSGIVLLSGLEKKLDMDGIPSVFVNRIPQNEDETTLFVESDNENGGYLAAKELLERGCRRIAFVTDRFHESSKVARYQGYCRALSEAGIEEDSSMIIQTGHVSEEIVEQVIMDRIENGLVFDGVMCTTDILAMSSILALQKKGLRVPEDVKVTGYDDVSLAKNFQVPITTIHQHTDKMAKTVADLLFDLIDGAEIQQKRYRVPVDLVRRKSTMG